MHFDQHNLDVQILLFWESCSLTFLILSQLSTISCRLQLSINFRILLNLLYLCSSIHIHKFARQLLSSLLLSFNSSCEYQVFFSHYKPKKCHLFLLDRQYKCVLFLFSLILAHIFGLIYSICLHFVKLISFFRRN